MSGICVTNRMSDVRSCTIKGQHQVVCTGAEYRWNADHSRDEATGRVCEGCLPKLAHRGLICRSCKDDLDTALAGFELLADRLSGIDRAVQHDNGGVRTQSLGSIPISAVSLMLGELSSYLGFYRRGATPEIRAQGGVRFAQAYRSAVRNHPTEETAHPIRRIRCAACQQQTLVWNPVTRIGGAVQVKCSNPKCGVAMSQNDFEAMDEKPARAPKVIQVAKPKKWLSVKDAAIIVNRHERSIYRWVESGQLGSRTTDDGILEVSSADVARVESVTRPGRPRKIATVPASD